MPIKIKILQQGDRVLNVWQDEITTRIVVQKNNGEACIYSISSDENNLPRIDRERTWTVTFGDGEIEADCSESVSLDNEEKDTENQELNRINKIKSIKTF